MNSDLITYRQANPSDAALAASMRLCFLADLKGAQDAERTAILHAHLENYFREAITNNTYLCWLAEVDGIAVGVGGMVVYRGPGNFMNPDGWRGYIMNMFTVPAYRRKGIAYNLLQRLMDSARALGVQSFELHATPDGEPVYLRAGFERHKEPTYRKHG